MGISEMTYVSYLLTVMAVVFGCVSVVMYFVFDIRRCWRIVRGRSLVAVREKAAVGRVPNPSVPNSVVSNTKKKEDKFIHQKTEKLAPDLTEMLLGFEETTPLDTMTLVQDIVMMTDVTKMNNGQKCQ